MICVQSKLLLSFVIISNERSARTTAEAFVSLELHCHNMSSLQKQKAKMLVEMANAVEDSNAKRRQLLQEARTIDEDHIDNLIHDLNHPKGKEPQKAWNKASHTAVNCFDGPEEAKHDERGSPCRPRNLPNNHHHGTVSIKQVRLLYKAMINYRENADLRYQQLELRYLDLSQSLLQLESKYRTSKMEKEALQRSCQAIASAMGQSTIVEGENSGSNSRSSDGPPGANAHPNDTDNNGPRVPAQRQELLLLQSQRDKLLQANLELRRHIKEMQLGETSTCRRCHPDVFAPSLHRPAEAVVQGIVEQFHESNGETNNNSHNEDDRESNEEEGAEGRKNSPVHPYPVHRSSLRKHQDNMSLLGMQYASNPKELVWSPPPLSEASMGSMRHITSWPERDKSMRASRPSGVKSNNNNIIRQSKPTLTSILPGPAAKTKGLATNEIQPKRTEAKGTSIDLNDIAAEEIRDINLRPHGSEAPIEIQLTNLDEMYGPRSAEHQQYGMVGEFGPPTSHTGTHVESVHRQQHEQPEKKPALFRRKSKPDHATEPLRQTMSQQLRQAMLSRSTGDPIKEDQYQAREQSTDMCFKQKLTRQPDDEVLRPARRSFSYAPHLAPDGPSIRGRERQLEAVREQGASAGQGANVYVLHKQALSALDQRELRRAVSENSNAPVARTHGTTGLPRDTLRQQGAEVKRSYSHDSSAPIPAISHARKHPQSLVTSEQVIAPSTRTVHTMQSDSTEVISNRASNPAQRRIRRPREQDKNGSNSRPQVRKESSNSSMGSYFQRIKQTLQQEI